MAQERSLRRFIVASVLAGFVLCDAVAGITSQENTGVSRVDYLAKLNELVRKESDETLNAEPHYRKALELCVAPLSLADLGRFRRWPTELAGEQQAAMRKWVDANADALAELHVGTRRPCYWVRYEGDDISTTYGTRRMLQEISLGYAVGFRAKLEAQDGGAQAALQEIVACYRLGSDLKKRLLQADQLTGIMIVDCALSTGFQILDRTDAEGGFLESLRKQLAELSQDQNLAVDLAGDQLLRLQALERIYAEWPGSGGGENTQVLDKGISSLLATQFKADFGVDLDAEQVYSSIYCCTQEQMANLIRKAYVYYSSVVRKTPFQQHEEEPKWERAMRDAVNGNALLITLAPPIPQISAISFRCRARRDALMTTLALLRCKMDKGDFPASLQELSSGGYISQLPMDPYSDKPLIYRRGEKDFTLYSVGADFQDNGGNYRRDWGPERQGEDFIFWPVQMREGRK